ncbi:BlaI/MecI/CopY family transcriptional regulator [Svornostia abyssi]|uniref:BlaI/MecI/CopY family transcriptional regulator n=1 Tax=Svornostia abyssi TaxID=2898438 RepID=A0ABY5PEH6_9ACTN|nr:BlaI/MecI/CopY family transcriptional regulator [Parviterribacteraceae bacterium J379]
MDIVWREGRSTVREVLGILNATEDRVRAYTTVLTIMQRLDDKGLLERERDGRTDVYRPALTAEVYRDRRAAADIDDLLDRYEDEALVHFARRLARLDPDRRRRLQRLARRD